jgi:protein-arginine kinase activator protein McsA
MSKEEINLNIELFEKEKAIVLSNHQYDRAVQIRDQITTLQSSLEQLVNRTSH